MAMSSRPWIGRINELGRITWRQSRALHSELLRFPGRYVFAKLRLQDGRTAEQLAYWFAVPVRVVSKATGYTDEQTHMFLVANCFGVLHDKATGIQVLKEPTTSGLSSRQWGLLLDWVGPWAKKTYGLEIEAPRHLPPPSVTSSDRSATP